MAHIEVGEWAEEGMVGFVTLMICVDLKMDSSLKLAKPYMLEVEDPV